MLHAMTVIFPIIRGLILASLLLLIGVAIAETLFRKTIAGNDPDVDVRVTVWLLQLPRLFGSFLLVLCLARSAAQLASFMLPGDNFDPTFAKGVLTEDTWGSANVLQTLAAALLFVGGTVLRTRPRPMRALLLVLLPVLIWTQTGMGHGADEIWPPWIGRLVHSTHLIGGGIWLGTLAVLSLAVFPLLRGDARIGMLSRLVSRFSISARLGALLVVTSGLLQLLRYGVSIEAGLGSIWGRLLAAKLICFLGVLALGAWNWRRVTPALERQEPGSVERLRSAVRMELLLGTLMLIATAMLVGSALPERPKSLTLCQPHGSVTCQPTYMKRYPVPRTTAFADSKSSNRSTNYHSNLIRNPVYQFNE